MNERFVKCAQRGEEWLQAHCGKLSASNAPDVMNFRKDGKEGADRKAYRGKKLAEVVTGLLDNYNFVSKAMEYGIAFEDEARRAYTLRTGQMVDQIGYVIHPTMERVICSPDGLIGDDGGLEIKVPETSTFLRWVDAGVVPEEHRQQMYMQMACAGLQWVDFCAYDPRMPKALLGTDGKRYDCRLFIRRLEADAKEIAKLEDGFAQILREIDADIASLPKFFPEAEPEPEIEAPQGEEWLQEIDFEGLK